MIVLHHNFIERAAQRKTRDERVNKRMQGKFLEGFTKFLSKKKYILCTLCSSMFIASSNTLHAI